MSGELVTRDSDVSAALATVDRTVAQLRDARSVLPAMSADALLAARAWAELVGAAARAKQAKDIAREAAETQVRLERRLGELVAENPDVLDVTATRVRTWKELAGIPKHLFERVVDDMLARGKSCSAPHVVANAKKESLVSVESGIWRDYSGTFWLDEKDGRGRLTEYHGLGEGGYYSLQGAREYLRRSLGLRKSWHESPARTRLDDAHARSRRLAQALSLLGTTLSGEERKMVSEAELLQAKVAELLHKAWLIANESVAA